MKRNRLLSWMLSIIMALTIFSIPVSAFADLDDAQETDGASLYLDDNSDDPEASVVLDAAEDEVLDNEEDVVQNNAEDESASALGLASDDLLNEIGKGVYDYTIFYMDWVSDDDSYVKVGTSYTVNTSKFVTDKSDFQANLILSTSSTECFTDETIPDGDVAWVSSNPKVASFDKCPMDCWQQVFLVGPGTTKISAKVDNVVVAEFTLKVEGPAWTTLYDIMYDTWIKYSVGATYVTATFGYYENDLGYLEADYYQFQRKVGSTWKDVKKGPVKWGTKTVSTVKNLSKGSAQNFRIRYYKVLKNTSGATIKTIYSSWRYKKLATKPAKVTLRKLKTKKRSITAYWKKTSCTGYQVQISKDKTFKKTSVTQTYKITKPGTLSKKMKKAKAKLKKRTRYYVRVRAYKTYGITSYGAWSKVKSIKCR